MHRFHLLVMFVLSGFYWVVGQCPEERLLVEQYAVDTTSVQYGQNMNFEGDTIELYADVYTPENDTFAKRPLVILAFGGSFVSGQRDDVLMSTLCNMYAAKGWTAASIDYRLFPNSNIDSLQIIDANVKAVGDMKAAVRYFRKSVEEGNPFAIDPEFVVVGGYSAGAFTALHTTYLNEDDDIPPVIDQLIQENGGFEGNTGDVDPQAYPSSVQACLNFSGAMFDPEFLDEGEPPLMSMHGTSDQVVPFGKGQSVDLVSTFGSQLLHQRAEDVGVPNYLVALDGGDHVGYWLPFLFIAQKNQFFSETDRMLRDMYCAISTEARSITLQDLELYPHPAGDWVRFKGGSDRGLQEYELIHSSGSTVKMGYLSLSGRLDLSNFPSGFYVLNVKGYAARKLIISR